MIYFERNFDSLTDFHLNHQKITLKPIEVKEHGLYHPGFILHLEIFRDPTETLVRYFFPTAIIDLMLLIIYQYDLDATGGRIRRMKTFLLALLYLFE